MSKSAAIVLVSGGMDSLVTAAIAAAESESETESEAGSPQKQQSQLYFLHVNYGQKTETKELLCFKQIADFYNVPDSRRKIIDLSFLKEIGGSSLTDKSIDVEASSIDLSSTLTTDHQVPNSYVPFRNTILISLAVAWAEVTRAKKIYIGAVHEDSSGYPDCRPSYYRAMNQLIAEGTKSNSGISVVTPVIQMSKREIVLKGHQLRAPFNFTWSCYSQQDIACGVCDSCVLRIRAFKQAGIVDPISYKK